MQHAKRTRRTGRQVLPAADQSEMDKYKAQVVAAFLASGKTIADVAHEYNLTEPTVREWIRQAADDAVGPGTSSPQPDAGLKSWAKPDATSAERQAEAVALFVNGGKTIAEIASGLNLAESTVREWLWYAPPDSPVGQAPASQRTADESAVAQGEIAAAQAEAAEAVAKAAKAERAMARAKTMAAKAVARAETAAAEAEAVARLEIAAAYAAAVEAMVRAEVAAAEAVARAEVGAAEKVARAEAAAAEAMARAQAAAVDAEAMRENTIALSQAGRAEAVAQAEEIATEAAAVAQAEIAARMVAEAAARDEIAAAYAAAVEAMIRAEVSAAEKVARAEAAAAAALAQVHAVGAGALARGDAPGTGAAAQAEVVLAEAATNAHEAARADAIVQFDSVSFEVSLAAESEVAGGLTPTDAEAEAAARAEIARLVSRLEPVELWVQATGRTVQEARQSAVEQLGVEDDAAVEIEVLAKASRWGPGRVRIRARVRVAGGDNC